VRIAVVAFGGTYLSAAAIYWLVIFLAVGEASARVQRRLARRAVMEVTGGERIQLTTKRCLLRPITAGDADQLHQLWSSPGVRRFLWDDEVIPMARTLAAIEQSQRMFREQGFGLWGAWPTGSPNLSAFGGLWPFRDPPQLELLYGVAEHLWGRGYATEVAQAVIEYCFDSLNLPLVRASTDVANVASIRVLEKLGFVLMYRSTVGGLDTVFYELQRHAV
jgi:ribosomal-protein-alanine N-acetyltransferase